MSKILYIIGIGPSINDVTEEEWEFLKDKDTIGFAATPFTGKPMKYFYSHERKNIDRWMLEMMAKNGYLDTILILCYPESMKYAVSLGYKKIIVFTKGGALFFPTRTGWFTDEENPPCSFKTTRAKTSKKPIFRFRGQLTGVINMCIMLGADEIRLIGVDLKGIKNFYEYDLNRWMKDDIDKRIFNDYMNLSKQNRELKNQAYNTNVYENELHITALPHRNKDRWGDRELRGMLDLLPWIDKELREEGLKGIYVTNKKSKLYELGKLEYRGICD
jgi:hypothetical protein